MSTEANNSSADERFIKDVAGHEMNVLHEDGIYRHLRFEPAKASFLGTFDIVTWPHNLVIKSGWAFHFSEGSAEDMFDMFRRTARTGEINPGHWSGKVIAGHDRIMEYSPDLLKKRIEEIVQEWIEEGADEKELRAEIHEHFFDEIADYGIGDERSAERSLETFTWDEHYKLSCVCGLERRFEHSWEGNQQLQGHLDHCKSKDGEPSATNRYVEGYQFDDWWEIPIRKHTEGFLTSCRSIRHGITLWDAARTAK